MLEDFLVGELVAINSNQALIIVSVIWIPLTVILILNRFFPSVIGLEDSEEIDSKQIAREELTDNDSDSNEIKIETLDDDHAKAVALDENEASEQLDVEEFAVNENSKATEKSKESELDLTIAKDDAESNTTDEGVGEVDPEIAEWFPVDEDETDSSDDEDSDSGTKDDTDKADDKDSDSAQSDDSESLDSILSKLNLPSKVKLIDDAKATAAKAYSSSEHEAVEVGSKFADELEKLGFEIVPTGHSEAKAVKGDVALKMAITPENAELTDGDELLYPDLDADAVVVQIWLED